MPALDIASGASILVNMVMGSITGIEGNPPKVLLISPPPILEVGEFSEIFEGGEKKSLKLGEYYERIAKEDKCYFLDSSKFIEASIVDGIHLEKLQHKKLGIEISKMVRKII